MEIVEHHPFRVTRNADVAPNEESAEDLLEVIEEELRARAASPAWCGWRWSGMPRWMLDLLLRRSSSWASDDSTRWTGRSP